MSTQGSGKRRAVQATEKPVKRTRVSRACDQCRVAREKCNGTQPTCSTCSGSSRNCTYTSNVKKRGIQPGYIRALELALAYLFQHDPENEKLVNDKLVQGGMSSILLSRNSRESNKLHKRWRKARFYIDIDKLLSGGEPSRHESELLSPDSGDEFLDTEEPPSSEIVDDRSQSQAQHQYKLPTSSNIVAFQAPKQSDARISMPQDSWRLLDVYFTYTQSWFPICEKHDVLKLSYSYPIEGLALSPDLPDSGFHAELWSILAVASMQEFTSTGSIHQQNQPSTSPSQLYATARSLIPRETGVFEIGHVKALLNLALVDIRCSFMEAAWLLVGYASRILEVMDQSLVMTNPRHKHIFHGCFLLENMLAIHLDRRPYFRRVQEVRLVGKIDEDGLDEWQPWNGGSVFLKGQQSRTPILALSSLNEITDIVHLLGTNDEAATDKLQRLEAWKSSLPPKLVYICGSNLPSCLTPPTVLLQLTYYCISLALTSSQSWLLRSLNLLEEAQDQIGWNKLPPVLRCLVDFINMHSADVSSSHDVQSRLLKQQAAIRSAWPKLSHETSSWVSASQAISLGHSTTSLQVLTPLSNVQPLQTPSIDNNTLAMPSPLDPALSDTFSMTAPARPVKSLQDSRVSLQMESLHTEFPNDLESFFDELASLDKVPTLDNQPQFMQNLGFAPDASMADLFSEYIPTQSTTFISQDCSDAVNLDPFSLYDES
ncbi:hypothetical protein GQ44DRAFT_735450 [Phaeosphaeriaceae sp. PMI808]|nr:hypothetical protein GQ44DRAFT_735450 [Phaeosphaeriaceae sp. PMI808]